MKTKQGEYRILYDYGVEGNVIDDGHYATVDAAIIAAVSRNYATKFRIIRIDWQPED